MNCPQSDIVCNLKKIGVKQMKDFRDGNRTDPMMSPMAKPLSDSDIENIAAYYSSL
jgi:cytochrome c553